jgi:hypothetical protein
MRLALKVAIVCSHYAAPATALIRLFASHHARNNDNRFIERTAVKHEVRMKQNFMRVTLDLTLTESK